MCAQQLLCYVDGLGVTARQQLFKLAPRTPHSSNEFSSRVANQIIIVLQTFWERSYDWADALHGGVGPVMRSTLGKFRKLPNKEAGGWHQNVICYYITYFSVEQKSYYFLRRLSHLSHWIHATCAQCSFCFEMACASKEHLVCAESRTDLSSRFIQ